MCGSNAQGFRKYIEYIAFIGVVGLLLVHVATYFGYLSSYSLVIGLSVICVMVFIYSTVCSAELKVKHGIRIGEYFLSQINAQQMLVGLLVVGYFFFNFFITLSQCGNIKVEGEKYWKLNAIPKEWREISQAEYNVCQPIELRGVTGHPLIFGIVGVFVVRLCRKKISS